MATVDYYSNYTSTQGLIGHDEALHTRLAAHHLRYNILPHLPKDRNARILDMACGYGRYLKALGDLGYGNASGIDISQEQIAYARDRLGLQNATQGDGLVYLKEYTETFDVILLLDILEHLTNDTVIEWLRLCLEALKPGGTLVIQVPCSITPIPVLFHGDFTHQRAYSPPSMSQALRLAGFSDFHHYSVFDSPYRVVGLLRMLLWKLILNPFLSIYTKILYGTSAGGIFTANLLTIARKPL